MRTDDRLLQLVDQAYAAAIDDSLWEPWAFACLREFGGHGGIFTIVDELGPTRDRLINLWPHPRTVEEYHAGLVELDPQIAAVSDLTRSSVYRDTDHVDLDNPRTREFTKWIEGHGGRHHMTGVTLLGAGAERACLSIHYSLADGPVPAAQQERLTSILPALGHAFRLGFQNSELLQQAYWDGLNAFAGDQAAVLVDERGRVIRASPAALRLLDARDGLKLSQRVLGCEQASDEARLGSAIAAAVRPAAQEATAFRLKRRSGRSPLLITAFPLSKTRRMLSPMEAAALVTIIDQSEVTTFKPTRWRALFELTRKEAELAELLAAGHSVESAAATLQMSMPTARTHLRSMFRKTGTVRQSNLLQLLSRLS